MRVFSTAAAAFVLIAAATAGQASGSGVGSTGAAPEFNGIGGSANSREARQLERLFRRGRAQVRKHITCKKCDLHKQLNKTNALEVAEGVIKGKYMIKEEDRTAVLVYLRDRYQL